MLKTNVVTQIAFLVHDIEKSCQEFSEFLGLENPGYSQTDSYEKSQAEFMGEKTEATAKLAFFPVGENLMIELIEPDHTPSVWRNDLNEKGEGFHHIAFVIEDMEGTIKRLETHNFPLLQKSKYEGGRYAYIDTRSQLKTIIELLEND